MSYVGWHVTTNINPVTMVICMAIFMCNFVVLSVMVTMIAMINFVGRDVQRLKLLAFMVIRRLIAVPVIELTLI